MGTPSPWDRPAYAPVAHWLASRYSPVVRASQWKGPDASMGDQQGPDTFLDTARVKLVMELAGWNTAELARKMHMDQSAVKRLLANQLQPGHKASAALRIAVWREFDNATIDADDLFIYLDENGKRVWPPRRRTRETP